MSVDLSIVIPVWNEETKIRKDIQEVNRFFTQNRFIGELIISDDGSSDRTVEVTESCEKEFDHALRVIKTDSHRGKGFAVKSGIINSFGKVVMYMDCGGNVPLNFINTGLNLINEENYKLVLGSRHQKNSNIVKNLVWYRRITSFIFRKFVKYYLKMPRQITDTQCGFKLFDGKTSRDIFSEIRTDGFLFDLEILLIATQKNLPITEFPIEWRCDRDSRLSVSGSFRNIFNDLRILKKQFQQ